MVTAAYQFLLINGCTSPNMCPNGQIRQIAVTPISRPIVSPESTRRLDISSLQHYTEEVLF